MFSIGATIYFAATEKHGPDAPSALNRVDKTRKKLIFVAAIILDVIVGILIAQFLTPYDEKWWTGAALEWAFTIPMIGYLINGNAPNDSRQYYRFQSLELQTK